MAPDNQKQLVADSQKELVADRVVSPAASSD